MGFVKGSFKKKIVKILTIFFDAGKRWRQTELRRWGRKKMLIRHIMLN